MKKRSRRKKLEVLYREHILKEIALFNDQSVGVDELVAFHAADGLVVDLTTKDPYRGKVVPRRGSKKRLRRSARTLRRSFIWRR